MVTLVVPFATGGSTDALARLIQPGLQAKLGRTVVVENKPGAGSSLGAAQVAKSAPDGSTLLVCFDSHTTIPVLLEHPPLIVETDLVPVMLVGTAPYVLAVNAKKSYRTFADVVAAEKANPGSVKYASTGLGTVGHLAMSLLSKKSGINLTHVAYRSGGLAMNDAIGGHVDMICGSAAIVLPQIGDGSLQPMLQMGRQRLGVLPNTPTAIEAGFPDFEALAWWGVFAPKGTPAALADELAGTIRTVLSDPVISQRLKDTQQMNLLLGGPAELDTFFKKQMATWNPVVREAGIRVQ